MNSPFFDDADCQAFVDDIDEQRHPRERKIIEEERDRLRTTIAEIETRCDTVKSADNFEARGRANFARRILKIIEKGKEK